MAIFCLVVVLVTLFIMACVALSKVNNLREDIGKLEARFQRLIWRQDEMERVVRSRQAPPETPVEPALPAATPTEEPLEEPPVAQVVPASPPTAPVAQEIPAARVSPEPPPIPATPLPKAIPVAKPAPTPAATPVAKPVVPAAQGPGTETAPIPWEKWLNAEGMISWAKVEEVVGKRWMIWGGVLALFVAMALFAKFAFDQKWIGPGTQILAAVATGLVLLGFGVHFLRKEMRPFGQGLFGGGIMILYAALFCAYSPEIYTAPPIHSPILVFSLMCVVTAIGMTVSVIFDALPIAFLSILGGLLTPLLVSTGRNERDGLFAYLMLLDLGVLGVAFYKKWRALDVLAYAGTMALFAGWFYKFYSPDPAYAAQALGGTMAWLGGFYAVFLVLPFINHLVKRTELSVERFVMALGNATFVFGYASYMLHVEHREALAGAACIMSAAYLVLGVITAKRIPEDRKSLFGFIGLSVALLTIAVPVYFHANGITVGWTVEAVMLLFLGYQFKYWPVRAGAFIVLLLAIGRVFIKHWPEAMNHDAAFRLIFNKEFLILLCAPLGAAAAAVMHQYFKREANEGDVAIKRIEAVGAGLMFLTFLHVEAGQWLTFRAPGWHMNPEYLKTSVLAVIWALGAIAFLGSGRAIKRSWVITLGLIPLVVALVHAVALYFLWDSGYYLFLNARFWSAAMVLAATCAFALTPAKREHRLAGLIAWGYAALLLLSCEVGLWPWTVKNPSWDPGYMSLWPVAMILAAGACVYFTLGARREENKAVRAAGLLPATVAFVFCIFLYTTEVDRDWTLALNWRFAAGLTLVATAVVGGATARNRTEKLAGFIGAGWMALALVNAEIATWLDRMAPARKWDFGYTLAWALALVWSTGALGFIAAYWWKKAKEAFWAGVPALAIGAVIAMIAFGTDGPDKYIFAMNWRFLAGIAAVAMGFAFSLSAWERAGRLWGCVFAGYAYLALMHTELWQWIWKAYGQDKLFSSFEQLWPVTLVWAVGTAAYFLIGRRLKAKEVYTAGVVPVFVGAVCAIALHCADPVEGVAPMMLFINARFLASAAMVAAAFMGAALVYGDKEANGQSEKALAKLLLWASMAGLLVALSIDPYWWCKANIKDPARAGMMAQMSLSIVWAAYATMVLGAGFWKRVRAVRFAALTLFAATGLKLVFVDMAGIAQIYRIVSFFVLGVLMIGSAYLYNKAENWLKQTPVK